MSRLVVSVLVLLSFVSILLCGMVGNQFPPKVHADAPSPALQVWNNFFGSNFTSLSGLSLGSTFAVNVNVTGAGSISGFDVTLSYAMSSLLPPPPISTDATHISLSPGLFDGSQCQVIVLKREAIGAPFYTIRVAAVILGEQCTVSGTGTLFSAQFKVIGNGVTSIDIQEASQGRKQVLVVGDASTNFAPVSNLRIINAYFRNVPGIPPIAGFTYTPSTPIKGDAVTFNGTGSYDPDNTSAADKGVSPYIWSFGDGSPPIVNTTGIVDHEFLLFTPAVPASGYFEVKLVVNDTDDNTPSESTAIVYVSPGAVHDVAVSIQTDKQSYSPGDPLQITVTVYNRGNRDENVTLEVTYDYKDINSTIADSSLLLSTSFPAQTFHYLLATGNLPIGSYTLTATARLGAGQVDANLLDNIAQTIVQVLPPPARLENLLIIETVPVYSPGEVQVGYIGVTTGAIPLGLSINLPPKVSLLKPDGTTVDLTPIFAGSGLGHFLFKTMYSIPLTGPTGTYLLQANLLLSTGQSAYAVKAFEVKPSLTPPGKLEVTVNSGSIYFPGDTAVFYITTQSNGTRVAPDNIRVVLVKPDGTNATLKAVAVSEGVFKAAYQIPTSGFLGTYELIVNGDKAGLVSGSSSISFEAKPTWLSSQANRILSLASIVGIVGTIGIAWRKGYLTRKPEED